MIALREWFYALLRSEGFTQRHVRELRPGWQVLVGSESQTFFHYWLDTSFAELRARFDTSLDVVVDVATFFDEKGPDPYMYRVHYLTHTRIEYLSYVHLYAKPPTKETDDG